PDIGQFTSTMQPRQGDCVASVVLDPLARLTRCQRRRADAAGEPQCGQLTLHVIAARPRFVDELEDTVPLRQPTGQLADRSRCVLDCANVPDLTAPPGVRYRNGDCGLVHIEADKGTNFFHDSPPGSPGPHPDNTQGAAPRH